MKIRRTEAQRPFFLKKPGMADKNIDSYPTDPHDPPKDILCNQVALSSAAGRYIFVRGEPPTCVHICTQLYNKESLLLLLIFYVTPLMSESDINQGVGIVCIYRNLVVLCAFLIFTIMCASFLP